MNRLTLIDTSVWIDLLRGRADAETRLRAEDLLGAAQVAMCPPVWLELYRGARGKKEDATLQNLRHLCAELEITGSVWNHAATLGRKAQQAGLQCPMADVLIFSCAAVHGVTLFARDKHMDALAEL